MNNDAVWGVVLYKRPTEIETKCVIGVGRDANGPEFFSFVGLIETKTGFRDCGML